MPNTLDIKRDLYNALIESFGKEALKDKLDDILLAAMENLLEKHTREILKFEEKYLTSFKEFKKMWDDGKINDKYSYEIESDFIDWEMLEMEKKELLSALSNIKISMKK